MVNESQRGRGAWDVVQAGARHAARQLDQTRRLVRSASTIVVQSGLAYATNAGTVRALIEQRLSGGLGLASIFRIHAAGRPDATALVDADRRLTYAEVDQRIDRVASALRRRGIGRGAPVLIVLHNRIEFIEMQAVITRIGGAAVSASWRSTADELAYLASHSGARAIVIEAELAPTILALKDRLGELATNIVTVGGRVDGLASYDELADHTPVDDARDSAEEGAVVIYTSGTTGKPKGAVRKFGREGQLAYFELLTQLPMRTDDRHLVVCPLYHSTAFAFATMTLLVGGMVRVEQRFDPARFLALIASERITTTAVVPTMLHRVLQTPSELREGVDTRSLRAVFSGGAPLNGTLARAFIAEFGHVLYNFYGATETGINTIATPDELVRAPGTIGHLVPGNEIRILDEQGREVPDGTTGELFVRNDMLVTYHRDDDATRASMRDGFFSVGDLAHRDREGLFHIDGRKRDMLISGGVNVYPAEVEEVLATHPAVAEVAVIGVPDVDLGERVRACVSVRPGMRLDAAELIAFARQHLSGPKIPRDVTFHDELPKNPTGKVLKRELRALAAPSS